MASVTALGSSSILVIRLPTPTHRMSLNLFVVLKSFHLLVGIIPTHLSAGMKEIALISSLILFLNF